MHLIDWFPPRSEQIETNIPILVDIWMQNFVKTFYFWRFIRVFISSPVKKRYSWVSIERSLWIRSNDYMKLGHWTLIGIGNGDIFDFVFVVFLNVKSHSLFRSDNITCIFLLEIFLLLESFIFEFTNHLTLLKIGTF